ncbi:MAG TPA: CotH kinase family protein, partial [Myxococcota bacterium]|nr:CotH kinase family protein [Myxococcota bacterium]
MLWLLACYDPTPFPIEASSLDSSPVVPLPFSSEEALEGPEERADAWIFSNDIVHQIEIHLGDAGRSALDADPRTDAAAEVWYDGEPMGTVGLRLRGKIGSFRTLAGKPKFQIDLNQFVPEQRFYGLEGLSLNNLVVDCSAIKEPIAYRIFEEAGVPSLRTAYAQVTLDGVYYGLYLVVETPDDRYLDRVFEHPEGNLYDGKYVWYGGYNYTLLDFRTELVELYQLEEGTDVGHADLQALTTAVETNWGTDNFMLGLTPYLRWDEYLMELAVEQLVGHNDGYALNTNNYRIYFDPSNGRAQMLPWDFDYAFLVDSSWGMSWSTPRGLLASGCYADPLCLSA